MLAFSPGTVGLATDSSDPLKCLDRNSLCPTQIGVQASFYSGKCLLLLDSQSMLDCSSSDSSFHRYSACTYSFASSNFLRMERSGLLGPSNC